MSRSDENSNYSDRSARLARDAERLVSVAIEREGVVHSRGFKEHWKLRAALGDEIASQHREGDLEGFLTSEDRFVLRDEAAEIAFEAGQTSARHHRLLSSQVDEW